MFADLPLHERLLKAADKLGFKQLTPVQKQAIPVVLEGKDVLVSAATGSGKTAAFLVPTLQRLMTEKGPKEGTRALILVPTRELARQVFRACQQLSRFTPLKTGMIIGGESFQSQKALFLKDPEILIATPGRLMEHLENNSPLFDYLEVLVLDEADRMLEFGFADDVKEIASRSNPEQRQTLLFSATLSRAGIAEIAKETLRDPKTITIDTVRDQHADIKQQYILADDNDHKERLLKWLVANESFNKVLIFTNTKLQANRLRGILRGQKHKANALHSDMTQTERNETMEVFRNGRMNILVATDVASRGLDVKGIDLVINFDLARNGDDYIHRIGRTGRAGEQGLAIAFVAPNEWNLKAAIEHYLKTRFESRVIKALIGSYKGPKKVKASGKAAGTKKKKLSAADKKLAKKKAKNPKKKKPLPVNDGFAPMRKKKSPSKLGDEES